MPSTGGFDPQEISRILVDWFVRHGRHLPWRPREDPYRIWLMVVMLQQTRVETVLPYYERFVTRFPTLPALASAPEEDVLEQWKGMGYYSRARNLVAAAREMQASYSGRVPENPEELVRLPGVGDYTAAAVASIAYDFPAPAVDGNVLRFLARFFGETGDIGKPRVRARLHEHARALMPPPGLRGLHNQAVMDFGALVCAPAPRCRECPVRTFCAAFASGSQHELPVRGKKSRPAEESLYVALIRDAHGRTLLFRRPPDGLLANFWELPNTPASSPDPAADFAVLNLRLLDVRPLGRVRHVFSHRIWNMNAVQARIEADPPVGRPFLWAEDPLAQTLPRAFSRIIETFGNVP